MRSTPLLALATAALLAACGSVPSSGDASSRADANAAIERPTLADEQRRLAQLFRGTPVVFSMQRDGSLRVDVPLRYCFDGGRTQVKPPFAAVLDRVAVSQRGSSTRFTLAAPADANAGPPSRGATLAMARTSSARDYLVARGVEAARLALVPAAQDTFVRVVIADPQSP